MEATINNVEYESKSTGSSFYECEKCAFRASRKIDEAICEGVYAAYNKCTDLSLSNFEPVYWVKKEESTMKKKPHPQAALMLQYAQDMAEDSSIVWQWREGGSDWYDLNSPPVWNLRHEYRRKPKEPVLITKKIGIWMKSGYFHASVSNADIKNVEAVFNDETGELISIKKI